MGLEQIIAHLAGLDSSDVTPFDAPAQASRKRLG